MLSLTIIITSLYKEIPFRGLGILSIIDNPFVQYKQEISLESTSHVDQLTALTLLFIDS